MTILDEHPDGLLWAWHFRDGGPCRVPAGPLPANLRFDAGWAWAHFPLRDQRARTWIAACSDLPGPASELLLGADVAPRIGIHEGWVWGVLPDFERDLEGRAMGFGRLRFAFDGSRIITTRGHPLQVVDDFHRRFAAGAVDLPTPLDAFLALNRRYCEFAEDHLDERAEQLDAHEDRVLGAGRDLEQIELAPLRRELSRQHRDLAALRTAFVRAASRHQHVQAHPLGVHLPALVQQLEDVDREIVALQDRARLVHEEVDTKITSATNRSLRALTLMSAMLMPPTLAVGAFGMNVPGIWFDDSPAGFLLAFALSASSAALAWQVLRRFGVLE